MNKLIKKWSNRFYHLIQMISSDPFFVADLWRKRGVKIGLGTCIYRDVILDDANGLIQIGKNCVLTGCTILTHDASTNRALGMKYGEPSPSQPVIIEDDCFIGYGSIILMGVEIGRGAIVGAGSVVTRNVEPCCVVAGNPAKVICTVDELIQKRMDLMNDNLGFPQLGEGFAK